MAAIAEVSVTDSTIGKTASKVEVIRNGTTSAHRFTIRYGLGSIHSSTRMEGVIVENTAETSFSWVPPAELANAIPYDKSYYADFTIETWLNGELVGTRSDCYATLRVDPSLVQPRLSDFIARDVNAATLALTGDPSRIVQGKSAVELGVTPVLKYGARLSDLYATLGGTQYPLEEGKTVTVDNATCTNSISGGVTHADIGFVVVDSRGYRNSAPAQNPWPTLVEWFAPTVSVKPATPDPAGAMALNISGTWFNGSFGAVDNAITVQYRTKAGDGEWGEWVTVEPTIEGNAYTADATAAVDYAQKVAVQARVMDALETAVSDEKTVRAFPVFYWGENDFIFNVPVHVNGHLYFDKVSNRIYALTEDGDYHSVFQGRSSNGNTVIGVDNYNNANGGTHVYGHDVRLGVSNLDTPTLFMPYVRKGQTISVAVRTTGYVSGDKTSVTFFVPFSRTIIGGPTVTASSNNGFILRQGGNYTHGSNSTTFKKPSSYEAFQSSYHGVRITATFGATTNAVANDAIGVYWTGYIAFT